MKSVIRQILREELTRADKTEIKKIARKEFEDMLKSSDIKGKIEDIVKKQLKDDKPTQKEVANITQKVLVQLYKTFWQKRTFWANKLDTI